MLGTVYRNVSKFVIIGFQMSYYLLQHFHLHIFKLSKKHFKLIYMLYHVQWQTKFHTYPHFNIVELVYI